MFDSVTGIHYINGHCALCNKVSRVMTWTVIIDCDEVEPTRNSSSRLVTSSESLRELAYESCHVHYTPKGVKRPCELGLISHCPETCDDQNIAEQCQRGAKDRIISIKHDASFRNVFCVMCHEPNTTKSDLSCNNKLSRVDFVPPAAKIRPGSFSLTLIFDFDPRKGLRVAENDRPQCNPGEVFYESAGACRRRRISCEPGLSRQSSGCVEEPFRFRVTVTGRVSSEIESQVSEILQKHQSGLEKQTTKIFFATLELFAVEFFNTSVDVNISADGAHLTVILVAECNCNFQITGQQNQAEPAQKPLEFVFRKRASDSIILFLRELNISLLHVASSVESNLVRNPNATLLDCVWLQYHQNETRIDNGSVTVVSTGKRFASGMFFVENEFVFACERQEFQWNTMQMALNVATLACLAVSIVCLAVRIILQNFVSSFQTRPGQLQLQLTIAMLFSFVLLIVGPFLQDKPVVCVTAAALLDFAFLATFVWMNIIAVDTWLVFCPSSAFSKANENKTSLCVPLCLGWGLPLLMSLIVTVLNQTDLEERFRPDFGGYRCWFTQRIAMLLYFGVPVGCSIFVNLVIFVASVVNLQKALQKGNFSVKPEGRKHFVVYVRLFVLMGITWSLGIISPFVNQPVLDVIFVFLSSLQGFFLFVSFTCNRRVITEVRNAPFLSGSDTSSTTYRRRDGTSS